jgi:Raf kinase inhibitor-like YbhB/YbcL family protein
MQLKSSAFNTNDLIPSKYTCDGQDISPALSWDAPPAGTQSLVLIVDDPDAPMGTFVHWVLYNLPPDLQHLPEHVTAANLPNGALQGKNDFKRTGYGGPCPPGGTHRYFFKLYAIDQPLTLAAEATKAQVLNVIEGHTLASTELVGRYSRQR